MHRLRPPLSFGLKFATEDRHPSDLTVRRDDDKPDSVSLVYLLPAQQIVAWRRRRPEHRPASHAARFRALAAKVARARNLPSSLPPSFSCSLPPFCLPFSTVSDCHGHQVSLVFPPPFVSASESATVRFPPGPPPPPPTPARLPTAIPRPLLLPLARGYTRSRATDEELKVMTTTAA